VAGAGGMNSAEESNLVVSPAAALRPSAEWSPPIREKPRMDGAPGMTFEKYQNLFDKGSRH
jgi:hypothetical protein